MKTFFRKRSIQSHLKLDSSALVHCHIPRTSTRLFSSVSRGPTPEVSQPDFGGSSDIFSPDNSSVVNLEGYWKGGFRVSGRNYFGSLFLFRTHIFEWHINSFEDITAESLEFALLAHPPVGMLHFLQALTDDLILPPLYILNTRCHVRNPFDWDGKTNHTFETESHR